MLTAAQRPIAMLIRYAVHFVDPEAKVILYGSQARGEANKWSDWDVVVLAPNAITSDYRNNVLNAIYDVELATNEIITTLVTARETWEGRDKGSLFYKNVTRDGIILDKVA